MVHVSAKRDHHPTFQGQEAHSVHALETHDALIVRNAGMGTELRALGFVALIGFDHLGDAPYRHLGGEVEGRAQGSVVEFLEGDLVRQRAVERFARTPVGGFVESFNRGFEFFALLFIGQQLSLQG